MTGPDVRDYINDIDPLHDPNKVPASLRSYESEMGGRLRWLVFADNVLSFLIVLAIMLLCAMISAWVRATFIGF
jgi:hypothetical protein